MEILDRLIAAGFGNRKPQWTITIEEFQIAMALPAEAVNVRCGFRVGERSCAPFSDAGRKHKQYNARGERRLREREELFPSWAVPVGSIRVQREITRCERD